jgi:23S rRNA U2552 (ribose-2'-O)-methylase RlmE/FtsJ
MSSVPIKPPWNQIQWFPQPKRFSVEDLSGSPIQGEWIEERNDEIETLKESIQPFDKTELWDLAKRITNPYELISTHSTRLSLPKSISCIFPLSRSYFKMVEMLTQLQFFDRHKESKLKSLHICEGPGGFIEAFYSMASDKRITISSSYAMTLRSMHVMVPGWRRATTFLQKNPTIQLLYGPSRTGNIYEPENQEECVKVLGPNGAHLVTADGGFDFSEDFHAQEKTILRLIVSSALILLRSVAIEGDIVFKLFDCNSPVTRDIIALLASCFQQWSLYKPVTSRPCNSEWYFLGKSAVRTRGPVIDLLTQIRDGLAQEPPVSYQRILTANTLEEFLRTLQKTRCEKQMEALKQVLSFCHSKDTMSIEELWNSQRTSCIEWCHAFRVATQYR